MLLGHTYILYIHLGVFITIFDIRMQIKLKPKDTGNFTFLRTKKLILKVENFIISAQ